MKIRNWSLPTVAAWLLLLSVGCIEYTVETQLNADGSGVRQEEMVVAENEDDDFEVSQEAFRSLMNVRDDAGWRYNKEEREGDEVHVFRRETRLTDTSSWSKLSGTIKMSGALARNIGPGSGNARYADVSFQNAVKVEGRESPDGRIYTYREVFYWENLAGAIVDVHFEHFKPEIERRYAKLEPESRAELYGFLKAGVWEALARGFFDMTESELIRESEPLRSRMTDQAVRVIRRRYPDVDRQYISDLFRRMIVQGDEDDTLADFVERQAPGVQLAGNTELVIRLSMPGRVIETNAHERDGSTLVWKFGPLDALSARLELVAESRLDRVM